MNDNGTLPPKVRLLAAGCYLSGLLYLMTLIAMYLILFIKPEIAQPLDPDGQWVIPTIGLLFWVSFLVPLIAWKITKRVHPFVDQAGRTAWNLSANLVVISTAFFSLEILIISILCGLNGSVQNNYNVFDFMFWLWLGVQPALVLIHVLFTLVGSVRAAYGQSSVFPLLPLIKR
jgi:uncharacterized Tic20 family protein